MPGIIDMTVEECSYTIYCVLLRNKLCEMPAGLIFVGFLTKKGLAKTLRIV